MKSVTVRSLRQNYRVLAGEKLIPNAGRYLSSLGMRGKAMIVTQRPVARHYLKSLKASLKRKGFSPSVHFLPQGERAKSERELFRLCKELLKERFERSDFIVALGGGVTGDLAGFAAAVYLRGIAFVNIPTTLLAQVDSAIGGKTAINMNEGKNLIGAFYPPRLVLSDVGTLRTLPRRELRASLAEVIKYGMIRDPDLFALLERSSEKEVFQSRKILTELVATSSVIKGQVVTNDEFEMSGERMILNYGHTFGHAFEKVLGFKTLMHGEAVALGMICAARLAVKLKIFPEKSEQRQIAVIKKYSLPYSLGRFKLSRKAVMKAMMHDKKVKDGKPRFVLPEAIGSVKVIHGAPPREVEAALREAGARQ